LTWLLPVLRTGILPRILEPGQHRYQWVPVYLVFNSLFYSLDN
jgi:hypothetical protein